MRSSSESQVFSKGYSDSPRVDTLVSYMIARQPLLFSISKDSLPACCVNNQEESMDVSNIHHVSASSCLLMQGSFMATSAWHTTAMKRLVETC